MKRKPIIREVPIKDVVSKALMEVLQKKKISDKPPIEEIKPPKKIKRYNYIKIDK